MASASRPKGGMHGNCPGLFHSFENEGSKANLEFFRSSKLLIGKRHYYLHREQLSKLPATYIYSEVPILRMTYPGSDLWFRRLLREDSRNTCIYSLQNADSNRMGTVIVRAKSKNEIKISTIYVKRPYRGEGVAKGLMRYLISRISATGSFSIKITYNVERSAPVGNLLKGLGFYKIASEYGRYIGGDTENVMIKTV